MYNTNIENYKKFVYFRLHTKARYNLLVNFKPSIKYIKHSDRSKVKIRFEYFFFKEYKPFRFLRCSVDSRYLQDVCVSTF